MKFIKLILPILFGFLLMIILHAEAYIPTTTLSSQSDVNNFNASTLVGNLIIEGSDISNLAPLSALEKITGSFSIQNSPLLTNLNGLSNLDFIGGSLTFSNNLLLASIGGLSKLDSVNGGLTIVNNPKLAEINFSNLTKIKGGLTIDSVYALVNIEGLSMLDSIGGDLTIKANTALTNIDGLNNLISLKGNLNILNNTSLSDYSGLFNLLNNNGLTGVYNVSGNAVNPMEDEILIEGLISLINNSGIPDGIMNSLTYLLENSEKSLQGGNNGAAINQLEAFINILKAQDGKKINGLSVISWIDASQRIIAIIQTGLAKNSNGQILTSASAAPKSFSLDQNYPNPFNPSTTIRYGLPENEKVTIDIYDLLGRKVVELVNGEVSAGYHEVEFNAGNLASGIYLYRLSAGAFTQVNKMLLMK